MKAIPCCSCLTINVLEILAQLPKSWAAKTRQPLEPNHSLEFHFGLFDLVCMTSHFQEALLVSYMHRYWSLCETTWI
jgi:hypothetical protein